MSATWIFLMDVAVTVAICIGLVVYTAQHLRSLLIELCGSPERANFWFAFTNVSLVIIPLIFALDYSPAAESNKAAILEIAAQLKYALIGFIITFVGLALTLMWFIPREKTRTIHYCSKISPVVTSLSYARAADADSSTRS